eukprot:10598485-Heterocapsa_arctica.AAC.1
MAWMLTCTMLQASYNINRENLGKIAPDIEYVRIQCPGRKQLTKLGGYMYEQMTLDIAMYLRTFLTNELLILPGWAGFMEQGHENQAWLYSPQSWVNGNLIHHQIQDWPGGIDRVILLLSRIEDSDLETMKTDPPHDPSGKLAPMTA